MNDALDLLRRSVEAVRAIDLDSLTDGELHELAIATQQLCGRLTAATAPLLQRWEQRGVWAGDGSRSSAARLARETRSSQATARRELRRARSLAGMPATSLAAVAGELSTDLVDLLATADTTARHDLFVEHEAALLESIRGLRYSQAHRAVRYWCHRADAELERDDHDADDDRDAARLSVSTTLDDMVVVNGALDPVGGAIVVGELDRLAERLRLDDLRDGVDRTPAQRRAAALVQMATRSATAPADGRAPRPLFTALIGDRTLTDLCELANGTVVTAQHLLPYVDTALLEAILFDGPTTLVSVSRKRSFTGALRRAIEARDRHCQHPAGCDEPAVNCDVDHIEPHARGGLTSQSNGRLECRPHNRNAQRHDHETSPPPERTVTRLDEIRARIRWRMRLDHPDDFADPAERDVRADPDHRRRAG